MRGTTRLTELREARRRHYLRDKRRDSFFGIDYIIYIPGAGGQRAFDELRGQWVLLLGGFDAGAGLGDGAAVIEPCATMLEVW
jgi:hypothetical protein